MSDAPNPAIEIYESPRFKKAFNRLSEAHKDLVDDEIGKIEHNPELGERKKGDLAHLWVHKFKLDGRETLLGIPGNHSGWSCTCSTLGRMKIFIKIPKTAVMRI